MYLPCVNRFNFRARGRALAPSVVRAAFALLLSFAAPLLTAREVESESSQLARAVAAQHAGDLAGAEQICLAIIRGNPQSIEARYELGTSYYMEHRWRESSTYLLQVSEAQPDFFPSLLLLGMDFLKLHQPKEAIEYLEHARRLHPNDEYANHNLASAEYMAKSYSRAAAYYISYLRQPSNADDVVGWYGVGEISLLLARRCSLQLARLDSSDPYRLLFLAQTYEEEENWSAALKQLTELSRNPAFHLRAQLDILARQVGNGQAKLDPEAFDSAWKQACATQESEDRKRYSNLGGSSDKIQLNIQKAHVAIENEDALTAASLLLETADDTSPFASFWTAVLLRQVSKEALQRVLAVSPDGVYSHLLRAQSEDAQHRTEQAVKEFEFAVSAAPEDATTYFKLGDLLWQAARYKQAVSTLQTGLRLDPENAAAYYEIGDSLLRLADARAAKRFLMEALSRDRSLVGASVDLGKIYRDEGNIKDSIAILANAAAQDTDGSVNYLLFRDYTSIGDKQAASKCLRRYRELDAMRTKVSQFDAPSSSPGEDHEQSVR